MGEQQIACLVILLAIVIVSGSKSTLIMHPVLGEYYKQWLRAALELFIFLSPLLFQREFGIILIFVLIPPILGFLITFKFFVYHRG